MHMTVLTFCMCIISFKVYKWQSDNFFILSPLILIKPSSAEELLGMLEFGNNNRTQHPTDANAQSSRSHAVFQV